MVGRLRLSWLHFAGMAIKGLRLPKDMSWIT
jgi:hypothetical protein